MVATAVLLLLTPSASREFPWTLAALVLLLAMHATYWIFTHTINKVWLRDQHLEGFSGGFIRLGTENRAAPDTIREEDWQRLRNRWERSHGLRAALAGAGFVCLVVAVVV